MLRANGFEKILRKYLEILVRGSFFNLFNDYDILLADADNVVLVSFVYYIFNDFVGGNVRRAVEFNNEYRAAFIVCEMKLVGFDVDIARKNIIKDYILDE